MPIFAYCFTCSVFYGHNTYHNSLHYPPVTVTPMPLFAPPPPLLVQTLFTEFPIPCTHACNLYRLKRVFAFAKMPSASPGTFPRRHAYTEDLQKVINPWALLSADSQEGPHAVFHVSQVTLKALS
jgi:hypothetical protein